MQPLFLSSRLNWNLSMASPEDTIMSRVWEVVKKILICVAVVAFYATTAIFFTAGFAIGFCQSKKTQKIIARINLVWETQPWRVLLGIGVGAFLSLPVTWSAASMLTGAYLGSKLYYDSKAIKMAQHT